MNVSALICGKDSSIQLTDIGNGVLRMTNNASDYTPEARSLTFATNTAPFADLKDNMYAYLTVAYFLPDAFNTDKDLWVDDTAYLFFSMGDEHSAYKATHISNAGGNKIPSEVGKWNVYQCPLSELRGDTFGILTEKGSVIYVAYIGVTVKGNPEHETVKSTRLAIPAGFHPLDICEYDENGAEIKRNLFPGNAAGSIDPIILDVREENGTHSELVQVMNYAGDFSYDSRSFRFMGDPISDYRNVPGAKLVFDIWMPPQYGSDVMWSIDDKAAMYLAINGETTAVTVNLEEYAAETDFAVKLGGWTHYEIPIADLNGGSFGFYTQCNTYFYYCNLGVVIPES